MTSTCRRFSAIAALAVLAGCVRAPTGPTVNVLPGPGKPFAVFQQDQAGCMNLAQAQVGGEQSALNQQQVANVLAGTAAPGDASYAQMTLQQRYDASYSQCMYARGNQVPGYAPVGYAVSVPSGPVADPLTRSVQSELIRLGYLHDAADGVAGPRTRTAIVSFEKENGLSADGAVSSRLLARLQTSTATASARPTTSASGNSWVAPVAGASSGAASPGSAPTGSASAASPTSFSAAPISASATPAKPATSDWVAPTQAPAK